MAKMDWDRVNREARLLHDSSDPAESLDFRRLGAGERRQAEGDPLPADPALEHEKYGHVLDEPKREGRSWKAVCSCGWTAAGKETKVLTAHRAHRASIDLIINGPTDDSVPGHREFKLQRAGERKAGWMATCEGGEQFGPSRQHAVKRAWRRHEEAMREIDRA